MIIGSISLGVTNSVFEIKAILTSHEVFTFGPHSSFMLAMICALRSVLVSTKTELSLLMTGKLTVLEDSSQSHPYFHVAHQ